MRACVRACVCVCVCVSVQVVMSAVWAGGMLGVAYYLVDTGHLYIMPDAAEREDFGLLRRGTGSE